MERLINGALKFREDDFNAHSKFFKKLGRAQAPHTLFIGCSDSRVDPSLITKTAPGELFVVRNIGNLVPPYRETQDYVATTSAIEYALYVLNIENILVCGHSNCGGCNALWEHDQIDNLPHVKKWLELALPVCDHINKKYGTNISEEKREWLTEQINVIEQLKHLFTYPQVKERYAAGKLKIIGWHYIIETGEVFNFNYDTQQFELIESKK